jgi:adenosine/AMP deaminase-like protein
MCRTLTSRLSNSIGTWWALDLAAFLLSPIERVCGFDPGDLDPRETSLWIRRSELPWAPGMSDLAEVDWQMLAVVATGGQLVDRVLSEAASEMASLANAPARLVASRRVPQSTLLAYGAPVVAAHASTACADSHVHQGAALPLEITLHWIARQLRSITVPELRPLATRAGRPLRDVDEREFHPLPLLFVLRAVWDGHREWRAALELARMAALGDDDALDELARLVEFEDADATVPSISELVESKRQAREGAWDLDRLVALLRIESVLHGAVTQRSPGLDVFVDLFEDLASIRRERLTNKAVYFERAIAAHLKETPTLKALELRLGEPVFAAAPCRPTDLAVDYLDALEGYKRFSEGKDNPIRVTFPLGLIKTSLGRPPPGYWRFDPGGICQAVEALIELVSNCPDLGPFVDGIDVSGYEEDAPNWLFAPMFERFARWNTLQRQPRMACRFHAGEWSWTPLHGLRRIAEFLAFDLPRGTPRRIGHALALRSDDWSRLNDEPVDELLDDLVWSYAMCSMADAPAELRRALEVAIHALVAPTYPEIAPVRVETLVEAYAGRRDTDLLQRIGFLSEGDFGELNFADAEPSPGSAVETLVVAHLAARDDELPTVLQVAGDLPQVRAHDPQRKTTEGLEHMRMLLDAVYEVLAPEIVDDIRWGPAVVEACPTSNVLVGGVRGFRAHPMTHLIQRGVLVTLGSDDPSLFHSWVGGELENAVQGGAPRSQMRRSQKLAINLVAPSVEPHEIFRRLEAAITQVSGYAARAAA